MNGIDKITARILADAVAEAARLKEESDREAAGITEEYQAEADQKFSVLMDEAKAKADNVKEQLLSAARLEMNKQVLNVKQELMDEAFRKAGERLRALPEEEYLALLVKLAEKACRTGAEQIILNAQDREKYGVRAAALTNEKLAAEGKKAEITLSELSYPIDGGLVLKDGAIEVNCSISALVETRREELSVEAAQYLFR